MPSTSSRAVCGAHRRRPRGRCASRRHAAGRTGGSLGRARLPIEQFVDVLEAGGFHGSYDVEIFSDDGTFGRRFPDSLWELPEEECVARATALMRRLLNEMYCNYGDASEGGRQQEDPRRRRKAPCLRSWYGIGIIGSQFEADIHAASIAMGRLGKAVAVASPTPGHAEELAQRYGIERGYTDYNEMLKDPSIEMVTVAAPNYLHCEIALNAVAAGKHVVMEKPMAMTVAECDRMNEAADRNGVHLFYAEELYFTPKYCKAKEMADQGAFGEVYLVKQSEMHFGPHADWFWDVERSGGGVFMDMGCHGIAFCYWFLGRPAPVAITAQMGTYVHGDKTTGEDHSFAIVEFANGAIGHVEDSWARRGGMDDRIEVYGDGGVTYGNLHMGNALPTYSESGYGYAVEKAPSTQGWSYPVYEELWNYGFPQEMEHFARCVRGMEEPQATGRDGRVVQELLYAGYQSAGRAGRVELPFDVSGVAKPIDLWRSPRVV